MKALIFATTLAITLGLSWHAAAQGDPGVPAGGGGEEVNVGTAADDMVTKGGETAPGTMRAGAYLGMGMANAFGDFDDEGGNRSFRFAASFGANFNYFLTPMLALDGGLGIVGKGYRGEQELGDGKADLRQKFEYLEIPLGVLLEIKNIQIGAYLALNFALSGKTKTEEGGDKTESKWSGSDWDNFRRVNIAPKFFGGYKILLPLSFAKIYVIPGIDLTFHLINDGDSDDVSARMINIMFRAGAAYEF